jgi:hypothetical protein
MAFFEHHCGPVFPTQPARRRGALTSWARKEPLAKIAKSLKRTEGATRHKATVIGLSLSLKSKTRTLAKKR